MGVSRLSAAELEQHRAWFKAEAESKAAELHPATEAYRPYVARDEALAQSVAELEALRSCYTDPVFGSRHIEDLLTVAVQAVTRARREAQRAFVREEETS